jgi:hypothetical protein
MGFDLARLEFYRWLVENGQNPEYEGVKDSEQPANANA